jgi:fibronectin-binding autotransporter adhesin
MFKRILAFAFFAALAVNLHAQNLTTVSASNIQDINGSKLAAGQLCFLGTDQSDNPISFGIGGGGQALRRGYCSGVTAGVVTSFTVPNPASTLPSGIYYRVTVKDSSTGQEVLRYAGVTFAGATFNFDNYQPVIQGASLAPLTGNSVTGNLAVTGNVAATGTVTGSNIAGGQIVTGAGTTNTVPKYTNGASAVIGNSSITDNGTTVNTSEPVSLGSTLGVTGATTLSSTLGVTGAATLSSTLGVTGAVTLSKLNNTIYADQQSGADACAKITTALGLLPATGGIVDATGFQGNQVCAAGVTFPANKPITLKLGAWALIAGANTAITVPANGDVCIKGFGPTAGGSGTQSIITSSASTTAISWAGSHGCLEDVAVISFAGDGLTLTASGTNSVQRNHFKNIQLSSAGTIVAGKIGLREIANSGTALVTENTFDTIWIDDFDISEQLETSGSQGPTDNYHFGWTYSGFAGAGTAGIKIISGDVNTWTHGFTSLRTTGVRLTAGNFNMFLGNRFETGTTDVNDGGGGTIFIGNSFSNCSTSAFDATATLVGSTGNTSCSFDILPRGLALGSQGLIINGSGSGKATIVTPSTAGTPTITTQTTSGTLAYTTQQNLIWGCTGTATSSQTLFLSNPGTVPCTQTAVTSPGQIGAVSGTLKNLAVNCSGGAGKTAGSGVFTVDVAGSDTALTCTVGTGFACADNSHSVAYPSPQVISIKYTTQATETLAGCAVAVQLF